MRFLLVVAAIAAFTMPATAAEPVKVMVLGSWHFGDPGLDVVNVQAEDVRTAKRQRELEAIAKAIAEFRPTKIMIERVVDSPDLIDPNYAQFTPAKLTEEKDERVQIAYRLAHRLGHKQVYGIDEQPSKGEPVYFPIDKVMEYAQANGEMPKVQAAIARVEAEKKQFQERQARTHLATLLAAENDPASWQGGMGSYYQVLDIGDTEAQPGADLNAMWYLRNAKIFAKLMEVAEPGDRILTLFGSGHSYWLRHFAAETPGYQNVSPDPYLKRAAGPAPAKRRKR